MYLLLSELFFTTWEKRNRNYHKNYAKEKYGFPYDSKWFNSIIREHENEILTNKFTLSPSPVLRN